MKTIPVIFFLSLLMLVVACGKDKFETTPKIEIKDYSTRELHGGNLRIRLNYFDKEGDLGNGSFSAVIRRTNLIPIIDPNQNKADTFVSPLPDFGNRDQGEIIFDRDFNFLKESLAENDTIYFEFTVTDREGNRSDTLNSDQIVIVLP